MFISFFMQWLRKPIWGYPLIYPSADSMKSTFLISSYGGTRLPDTGKSVVPWVILDWWTPLHRGGKPEKELWLVTTGWLSGIWPARMGRRLNKRARSSCSKSWGRWMRYCQDLLSRDRKAGIHQLVDEQNIIPMSLARWKNRMFNNT